jgi:hypothetical protein
MKKYRLEIPDEYIEIMPQQAKYFNNSIVAVSVYNGEYCEVFLNGVTLNVFVSWLVELADEPMSSEELINEWSGHRNWAVLKSGTFTFEKLLELCKKTEENERKRHRQKFSALDDLGIDFDCEDRYVIGYKRGWSKANESRGYEE